MRISTSQIYAASMNGIGRSLNNVMELNTMTSSQKKLNSPKDNPEGMGRVMGLHTYDNSLSGYIENCGMASEYLSSIDQSMNEGNETMTAMLELAEQASTGTYDTEQLSMMAIEMRSHMDSMFAVSNTKLGDDYLFAGENIDSPPYELGLGATIPNGELAQSDIVSIAGESDYTVKVEFLDSGTVGVDTLNYRYSSDGGNTWTTGTLDATATPPDTTLDLGDCSVELATGTSVTQTNEDEGTQFMVRPAFIYTGTDKPMSVATSESTETEINLVGSRTFGGIDETGTPVSDPNLYETLGDLIAYMETGNNEGAAECLEELRAANERMLGQQAKIGATENSVTFLNQSQSVMQERTAAAISNEEDADATQLMVELEQAEYVYQAVLQSASKVMGLSILNYL